jgi:molybdopterin-synthase adenylyltransferase
MKMSSNSYYIIPYYLPLKDFQNEENNFIVELGAGESFKRMKLDCISMKILKKFLQPCSLLEILNTMDLPKEDVIKFCEHLIKEKIIIEHKEIPDDYKRYDRHLQYYALNDLCPIKSQEKLKDVSVTLVGVGGIGNWIALNLVGLGIKKIRLVDPDIIEESNLSRQVLFTEDDIGKLKINVAERHLKQRNKHLQVETVNETVNEENVFSLIENTNFVVLSADKPFFAIQKWLNKGCLNLNIPLLNVGYAAGDGLMGPLVIPGFSACLSCAGYFDENNYYLKKSKEAEEFSNRFKAPSFACLNSLISCMASYEIAKFFLGLGECITINHAIRINPLDFTIKKIYCQRNQTCSACKKI